ncbi:hypothetical protein HMPREF9318_00201 [Streptococcus urinalis FB127-CNA-2]|uniref:LysM domain-containing protein n=1 Tax=Streptococcus urinalis 2285-97 TaxID=764291 RepID=G5KF36_9STRE|nr:SAG1386/EF1546 family surface-associated protein [Streptococcus urinalis]EHJ56087.1 hypothetical protein STRUR_0940 [Streptococcus urinalis 2285-97]EKS22003.1 hypothetical protein HMPREF9318_00201 [Streptococcus urinalis FB127-CNA-2]VEF31815.1 30S ribosomal protein S15 [Streptococcus urinalis]
MAKKPWEEKIVDDTRESRTQKNRGPLISTPWLTALLSAFFVILVVALFVVFYTSNRGANKETETSGFYGASSSKVSNSKKASNSKSKTKSSVKESSTSSSSVASSASSSSTETSTSSSSGNGQTITVQSGEGAASIAARAGISVSQLESLNPDHMTQGYWYANPGDQVYIN